MVRRIGVLLLVLFTVAGCLRTPVPTRPLPTESPLAPLAVCRPGSFDPGRYPEVVAAGRGAAPALTDDLTAYALGLFGGHLFDGTELTVESGSPDTDLVRLTDGVLAVSPGSDVAPAELASRVVFVVASGLFTAAGSFDPDDPADQDRVRAAALTVAADTYIHLADTHPESTQGSHDPLLNIMALARVRLSGDRTQTADEVDARSPWAPAVFLRNLSNEFGHEYYRLKRGFIFQTRVPLPIDETTRLLDALLANC